VEAPEAKHVRDTPTMRLVAAPEAQGSRLPCADARPPESTVSVASGRTERGLRR
jgi:hypothetical protein